MAAETQDQRWEPGGRGLIDGMARMLREVLATPRMVEIARVLLGAIDPEAAPALVRVLARAEPMLFLDALSSVPALVNAASLGAREVCEQILSVPEGLLGRYAPRLLGDVDPEALGEVMGLSVLAMDRLAGPPGGAMEALLGELEEGVSRGVEKGVLRDEEALDRLVARLAASIRGVGRRHPALLSRLVRPLLDACRDALEEADDA